MKIGLITTTALFVASSLLAPVSAKTEIIEQPSENNQCLQCSLGKENLQLVQRNRNNVQQRQQGLSRTRQPALEQRTIPRQPTFRQLEYKAQSKPQRNEPGQTRSRERQQEQDAYKRQVQTREQQQPVTRSKSQREQAARIKELQQEQQEAVQRRKQQQAAQAKERGEARKREDRREARDRYYWQRYPRYRYYGWYSYPSLYWGSRSTYPSSLWLWDTYVYDRDSTVYLYDRDLIGEREWLSNQEIREQLSDQEIKALDEFAATSNSREASETSDKNSVLRQREAEVLNDAGTVYRNQGKHTEALKYYKQALAIFREIGDRQGEAEVLRNIGTVYKNQGKHTEALKYYEEALAIFREIGNPQGEAEVP